MILLWTTSDRWGSRLIRWGRGTDDSHFAVCFDKLIPQPKDQWLVGESRLETDGIALDWLSEFKSRNRIVHALEYVPSEDDLGFYCAFGKKMGGKQYDRKAVLWLAFDSVLRKLKISNNYSENKWGDRDDVYCTEVLDVFRDRFRRDGLKLAYTDIEMLDPHAAYELLVKAPQFRKIDV